MPTRRWPAVLPMLAALRPAGQCAVCRAWAPQALCAPCIERFAPAVARCARCALRLAVDAPACGECQRDSPPFERTVCAFDYAFPWDRLITQFKFHGHVELAVPLARQLSAALQVGDAELPELIVPVPLAPRRLRERSYNQAWELARRLARWTHRPARCDLLERPADGVHQVNLPLERRLLNLRGAFVVRPARAAALQQRHVALVDDVMTSGATLREAASTLLAAGARRIDAWVLARTPTPGA